MFRNSYPADWPKCACGAPVLDGHLTCGRVTCSEAAARTRQRLAHAVSALAIAIDRGECQPDVDELQALADLCRAAGLADDAARIHRWMGAAS